MSYLPYCLARPSDTSLITPEKFTKPDGKKGIQRPCSGKNLAKFSGFPDGDASTAQLLQDVRASSNKPLN